MKKVGIIGGSGFIESDIIMPFLNEDFDVKISTSDISKKENYLHLMHLKHKDRLYVCELDDTNKNDLKAFIKDCDYVVYSNNS